LGEIAIAFVNGGVYTFGGWTGTDTTNDLWVLSEVTESATPAKPVWRKLAPTGALPQKRIGNMAAVGMRLYIFAGLYAYQLMMYVPQSFCHLTNLSNIAYDCNIMHSTTY
jgi:hypothetical protein